MHVLQRPPLRARRRHEEEISRRRHSCGDRPTRGAGVARAFYRFFVAVFFFLYIVVFFFSAFRRKEKLRKRKKITRIERSIFTLKGRGNGRTRATVLSEPFALSGNV